MHDKLYDAYNMTHPTGFNLLSQKAYHVRYVADTLCGTVLISGIDFT